MGSCAGLNHALRTRTGRPHWLVLDEAHHTLPGSGGPADSALPPQFGETLLITVHPEHVSPKTLATVDVVMAIGRAMQPEPGRAERIRHRRKYAEGDLRWHSFYFRGPHGRTNLKAQNLAMFSHLAQGIDEETWVFHLRRGDYSRWFRHSIRDAQLAEQAERIERRDDLAPSQTREMIRELIHARYTLPG